MRLKVVLTIIGVDGGRAMHSFQVMRYIRPHEAQLNWLAEHYKISRRSQFCSYMSKETENILRSAAPTWDAMNEVICTDFN